MISVDRKKIQHGPFFILIVATKCGNVCVCLCVLVPFVGQLKIIDTAFFLKLLC